MSTGGRIRSADGDLLNAPQDPASLRGKVLRLNDDGSVPDDNPFVDEPGHRPEIYTIGHRNTLGLMLHPETGDIWQHENGPNGGDELNVLLPGRNYGWPLMSFGRLYPGARVSSHPTRDGYESPLIVWLPAIAAAGMAVYTGDRFPAWQGNVFVGSLQMGGIPGTGHLQRIVLNEQMEELRRELLLTEFRQRIREVRAGARRAALRADGRPGGRRPAAHRAGAVTPAGTGSDRPAAPRWAAGLQCVVARAGARPSVRGRARGCAGGLRR